MGSLTPGATYIYERDNDKIYARELGSQERRLIGQDFNYSGKQQDWVETHLWQDIVAAGKTNPSLQKVLDRAIMIYRLSKDKPL